MAERIANREEPRLGRRTLLSTLGLTAAGFGAVLALASCAAPPPPPPPPTVVQVTVAATANANPSSTGRPSPVLVRIYYLSSPGAFEQSDYFVLLNQEAQALGSDLTARDEVNVAPGASQTVRRELQNPAARYVGVAAFFQRPDGAAWRSAVVQVPPNQTTSLRANVQANSVTLAPGG